MSDPSENPLPMTIIEETEQDDGWNFKVVIDLDLDHSRTLMIRLGWVDYNFWSPSGSARPGDVVRAVLSMFLEAIPGHELQAKLDAARVRRLVPDADTRIPLLIRKSSP